MNMNLTERLNTLSSREDFVEFLEALRKDLAHAPDGWENQSSPDYLEAIAAWTGSMRGYYRNKNPPEPASVNWKVLAEILLATKYYE